MSKVNVNTVVNKYQQPSLDKVKGSWFGVPIFYIYSNSLYCLIRDLDDTYKIIDVTNGHVQAGFKYNTIEEFYKESLYRKFVDIEIIPTEIQ